MAIKAVAMVMDTFVVNIGDLTYGADVTFTILGNDFGNLGPTNTSYNCKVTGLNPANSTMSNNTTIAAAVQAYMVSQGVTFSGNDSVVVL